MLTDFIAGAAIGASRENMRDADRITFDAPRSVCDVDLRMLRLETDAQAHAFFDAAERKIAARGGKWWLLVDYTEFEVEPKAWVAFAHRAKKLSQTYTHGAARFDARREGGGAAGYCASRAEALARIDEMQARAR